MAKGYTVFGHVDAVASRWGGTDPSDSTTYYVGGTGIATTTAANHGVFIPVAGTIVKATITYYVIGTLGSNEQFTTSLRLNNSSDSTIATTCKMDARQQVFASGTLAVAVSAGDYVEAKIATPAWGTNPTAVGVLLTVYIA